MGDPGDAVTPLPPDDHVHSQWSWDTEVGDMARTCQRALDLGVPSVAFTEHVDVTSWRVIPGAHDTLPVEWAGFIDGEVFTPPPIDLEGYLACIAECRERFPGLRIRSGAELSEPHWYADTMDGYLARAGVDRVLASLHSSPAAEPPDVAHESDAVHVELSAKYDTETPHDVVREYLDEVVRMIEGFDGFEVLAHIDYPLRYWPHGTTPFVADDFEEEFRRTLTVLAQHDRVLELNTKLPMRPEIIRWWHECGGEALSFGSDAHEPELLARGFADAAAVAEAVGFRPGRDPWDFWVRTRHL